MQGHHGKSGNRFTKSNQDTRILALRDVRQVETLIRMLRALGTVVADFLRGVAEVSIRAVVHALE